MFRLTRDVVRSWFPESIGSKTQLENTLEIIIGEWKRDFCLQEILDITFKVFMEDIDHVTIDYSFYLIFSEIANKHNLSLYELTEQCVLYNMPEFRHVRCKYDRLQVVISRVVRFYGSHVNVNYLEKILYDVCKKELGGYCNFKSDFESIFKQTVKFFLNI